jgi:arylesterase/paraoxonase
VAYCGSNNQCDIANTHRSFSQTKLRRVDGHYYVVQSAGRKVFVYSMKKDALVKIDKINIGMGIDNLSVDTNGDIFVAGFSKVIPFVKAIGDPPTTDGSSTIFRIGRSSDHQGKATYEVTKTLEDIEGKTLPSSTVAIHDVKTDSFFMGIVTSPFIIVCKRQ